VERHRAVLLERIRLMLGEDARRQADSIDFLQEVFVEVLAKIDSCDFRDERALLRWMTTVARNDIRDRGYRARASWPGADATAGSRCAKRATGRCSRRCRLTPAGVARWSSTGAGRGCSRRPRTLPRSRGTCAEVRSRPASRTRRASFAPSSTRPASGS
jgi:hypothetical protein